MSLYLVQRATREDRPHKVGFDSKFRLHYMGSSEYEFGTVPDSLRRIRASRDADVSTTTLNGRTVYLYGSATNRDQVAQDLPGWVADGCPGKEGSWFHTALAGALADWQDVNLWWALEEDVMFTLDPAIAADIEDALTC